MTARPLVLLALLGLARCESDEVVHPRPTAPVNIAVAPPDLTSHAGGEPIEVVLFRNGPALDDALVAAIADTVRVVQDGRELAIRVGGPTPVDTLDERVALGVTLLEEITGWFEVRVTALEGSRGFAPYVSSIDGELRARIHPESAPVVRLVTHCDDGVHGKLHVELSERVALSSANPEAITAAVGDGACTPLWATPEGPTTPTASFACPTVAALAGLTIAFDDVRSPEGIALTLPDHTEPVRTLALSPDDAERTEPECLRWTF
ncbi:MAG: hypothetical protein IT385_03255 [Deltaproteobacteria bacterium]|nr:hypothetical protein [Deltaproteobacteria bacterium]